MRSVADLNIPRGVLEAAAERASEEHRSLSEVVTALLRCYAEGQTWANLPAAGEAPLRIGPVIFPVGHVHLDSDGIERVKNRWGFNSFTTQEGAGESLRQLARRGTWYIWRLADGSYTFTAVPDPSTPGHPAELVEEVIAGA
jgi:hypothetical protein